MCPRLLCRHSAGPRLRALFFYIAAWLGWFLGGFELGLALATDEPYLAFLGTPRDHQPAILAALLAVHAAAAGLAGLIAGRWADTVVETRALVIMAAIPQLLGATLYFFAGTLGELILARLITGVGAGAAVAMLCELLRLAPLRVRVASLAGLAIARELGTDIGPTIAFQLDKFPDLPVDVLHHRVTPWNTSGLLLLICHLIYLLLLITLYPNITLHRELELLEIRRLLFPEATAAEEAEAANPDENIPSDDDAALEQQERAEAELRTLAERLCISQRSGIPMGQCFVGQEQALRPHQRDTSSPLPAPLRTENDLATIGHPSAHPGHLQHLQKLKDLTGGTTTPAESGEETDGTATASSVEGELQFRMSSRPQTSDEEKNPQPKTRSSSRALDAEDACTAKGEDDDSGLRARRWPGSPDLNIPAPTSPRTPAEKTGWFTPDEGPSAVGGSSAAGHPERAPSAAGSVQEAPSDEKPPRETRSIPTGLKRPQSAPQPPHESHSAARPLQRARSATDPLPGALPATEAPDVSRHQNSGRPLPDMRHSEQDQPDRARSAHRPLEGPYSNAPEATREMLMTRMRFWVGSGDEQRTVEAQIMLRRVLRSWERVLVPPTLVLLACCLVVYLVQSALLSLLPHDNTLDPMGLTPRWLLGVAAVMRLFTSAILLASVAWEDGLGALVVLFTLVAMAVAQLCMALSLMELNAYPLDWSVLEKPSDDQFAWGWVLRVALCVQSVAEAVFEPVALALFSLMVPRTMMGRGVSLWMLTMRAGIILGPFWTVGLIGYPLPEFLVSVVALLACVSVLALICRFYLFNMRKMHVVVLDRVGPRLPIVGLRGRTLNVMSHLRQLYCAETAADTEGGAADASRGGAVVAPRDGDRRPLLEALDGR